MKTVHKSPYKRETSLLAWLEAIGAEWELIKLNPVSVLSSTAGHLLICVKLARISLKKNPDVVIIIF